MISQQGMKNTSISFFLLLAATSAQAGTMGTVVSPKNNFEISAAGGPNWFNRHHTHLVISPFETDSNRTSAISNSGAWKIGLGYSLFDEQLASRPYFNHLLLEMNVYHESATAKGSVWQYKLPQFNNYNFRAPLSSTRLMFDVKPGLFTWSRVSPYLILGVGATWNGVSYHEVASQADIDPASALSLSRKTNTHVAWDAGAGLKVALSDCLFATAEYVYAFLGHGSPAHRSTNAVALAQPPGFSFQTQSLLFGLSLTF